ncbi:hypothetical protein QTP70_028790 [Hemibagrus guttatus]|uniref:Chemokine interleukin-8-like domain-containing protein n=1 Tax=Hemibagrus guttatus TaxID=175788 RepID=A0AAE0UP96_9TELE|nr:hypothetical protein QTP70_028790 [Hemibagrus guttatus]
MAAREPRRVTGARREPAAACRPDRGAGLVGCRLSPCCSYEDCCLKYTKEIKSSVKKRVISYRRQEQDGGCNLPAIVFKLKSGRQFCAKPGEKWVQDLQKKIHKHPKHPKH